MKVLFSGDLSNDDKLKPLVNYVKKKKSVLLTWYRILWGQVHSFSFQFQAKHSLSKFKTKFAQIVLNKNYRQLIM